MKICAYLLLSLSFTATAAECNISVEVLSAYYQVTSEQSSSSQANAVKSAKTMNSQSQHLELHRNKNRVLKRNLNQGIHNNWTVNGERYSLTRAFDKYQHSIEYQANELNYHPKNKDIYQIIATPDLKKMNLLKEEKSGCQLEQYFTLNDKYNTYQLVWLPNLQLIKSFEVHSATIKKQWLLTDYQANKETITKLFEQYADYQTTDYADIGDNESIPFLSAMINQGFSTSQAAGKAHSQHKHEHNH